ncbi:F-box only protein 25 [Protopterus annectens]|uniref:F-box only protein 25 n=1 Tax=Protopterus annectens TaxID=7888 RepID=UPI001CFBE349|nr:F-box only protein 25 [Protopterus annectens]
MPFLGQDWRSPGWSWIKTEDGWKRFELFRYELENNLHNKVVGNEDFKNENFDLLNAEDYEVLVKKKKDHLNNNTKSQFNTIIDLKLYVRKLNLAFSLGNTPTLLNTYKISSIFNPPLYGVLSTFYKLCEIDLRSMLNSHVPPKTMKANISKNELAFISLLNECNIRVMMPDKGGGLIFVDEYLYDRKMLEHLQSDTYLKSSLNELLQLIAKTRLTSLSGAAQKNYFNILEKIFRKVLEDNHNPRLIKELLHDLGSTLCILIREVGRSVLVGNINIWVCRLEAVRDWQHQLSNLQIKKHVDYSVTLNDLPLYMQSNILYRFSDGWDVVNLGQVTPTLHKLSEDRQLWKKLCQYHFSEKQFCRHLILSEKSHIDWKLMYFTLLKWYPKKEQYGDTLQYCRHCSILFWKDTGHPCTADDPDSCFMPVSPQNFIDLFQF